MSHDVRTLWSTLRLAAAAATVATGVIFAPAACSSSTETTSATTGDTCADGVVIDGKCEGKCVTDLCLHDDQGAFRNVCVDNRCQLECKSHGECFTDGTQDCKPATQDDPANGADPAVHVCQTNGKANGIGAHCFFGDDDCKNNFGPVCPNGQPCGDKQCGDGDLTHCKPDPAVCAKDPAACDVFRCDNDGTPCRPADKPGCAPNECQPMTCLGTGKEGDADQYCTRDDCKADSDCAGGFYCGIKRDLHTICGTSKPQGGIQPCIDKATFTTDGKTYQEGPISALRNTCRKRGPCAPCESDVDCSGIASQKCVDFDGAKVCATECGMDKDCDADKACVNGTCQQKFGKCKGTGQFCEPCVSDLDCNPNGDLATSTVACIGLTGNMKACFDVSFPDQCTVNADCPKSPSGKLGTCLNESLGYGPSDSVYHRCYVPINVSTNKASCY